MVDVQTKPRRRCVILSEEILCSDKTELKVLDFVRSRARFGQNRDKGS